MIVVAPMGGIMREGLIIAVNTVAAALLMARLAVSTFSVKNLRVRSLSRYVAVMFSVAAAAAFFRAPFALGATDRASFDETLPAFLLVMLFGMALCIAGIVLGALVQKELLMLYKEAQTKVNVLSGLLPICMHCKRIRGDEGSWTQVESYVKAHSEADFSHGICPECRQQLYPEYPMGT
jgi:hypothetical protein